MTLSLRQIDELLADWKTRLSRATDNLLALDDLLTYRRLEGKGGLPKAALSGITAAQVIPALAAIHALFEHISLLSGVIERANDLRRSLHRFLPSDATLREIEDLLSGESITLQSVQTPLSERGLVAASETTESITPERLMEVMIRAFEAAKAVIFAVDDAWGHLEPALGEAQRQANRLQEIARSLGQDAAAELEPLRQKLASLTVQVETDPLGTDLRLTQEILPVLRRVRERLDSLAAQKNGLEADFARAGELLKQVSELRRQSEKAYAECRRTIDCPSGLKAPLEEVRQQELSDWLTTLDKSRAAGRWNALAVGLKRWLETAEQCVAEEQAACINNQAPLELRAELHGRLTAALARARAKGISLDAALTAQVRQAESLLAAVPTRLPDALRMVQAIEVRLKTQP
jgi:hypothetical protein